MPTTTPLRCRRPGLWIRLAAVPNPDFGPSSHLGSLSVAATWHEAKSLASAVTQALAFQKQHDMGGGNWSAGEIFRDGAPVARVSYNGCLWELDADGRETGSQLSAITGSKLGWLPVLDLTTRIFAARRCVESSPNVWDVSTGEGTAIRSLEDWERGAVCETESRAIFMARYFLKLLSPSKGS